MVVRMLRRRDQLLNANCALLYIRPCLDGSEDATTKGPALKRDLRPALQLQTNAKRADRKLFHFDFYSLNMKNILKTESGFGPCMLQTGSGSDPLKYGTQMVVALML